MDTERLENTQEGVSGWMKVQRRREGTRESQARDKRVEEASFPLQCLGVNVQGLREVSSLGE